MTSTIAHPSGENELDKRAIFAISIIIGDLGAVLTAGIENDPVLKKASDEGQSFVYVQDKWIVQVEKDGKSANTRVKRSLIQNPEKISLPALSVEYDGGTVWSKPGVLEGNSFKPKPWDARILDKKLLEGGNLEGGCPAVFDCRDKEANADVRAAVATGQMGCGTTFKMWTWDGYWLMNCQTDGLKDPWYRFNPRALP
ncbi:hypothetical protein CDD80_5511 [Ophiocordyceps camponoti-rufipedis]|uniref:Ecp2 effector protein domain-containing protein n=1 Tax=Ophiocordyceps camponoti-rufipedis TaxID=2004952 RepID=A0A2C5XG23_9HYPO|nr:hypothetical protein CDD80_5511 [Ophiocordyceps camponoti-rufipedis]